MNSIAPVWGGNETWRPNVLVAAQVPRLVMLAALALWRTLRNGGERAPFLMALGLFGLSFLRLGISIFPDVVPGRVTVWQAAAPEASQLFLLVGAAALIPTILADTACSYWVFRGKVDTHGYR
jgi:cytochrome d ubiquinol oxidase subunit II